MKKLNTNELFKKKKKLIKFINKINQVGKKKGKAKK